MKEKRFSWFRRIIARFGLETVHHRTCRLCNQHILRSHKYRHVKVGPFWVDQVEHKNCANPTLETPYQLAQRLMDVLPFDAPCSEEKVPLVDGAIYTSYDDAHQEKAQ